MGKKYDIQAKEKAYELFMVQQLPFLEVVRKMREEYPKFSKGTLTKWKNDFKLDWEGRYDRYCQELAERTDKERMKQFKPILYTIQEIREKIYYKLIDVLEKPDVITDKNIGHVLSSFVKLGDLEYKMTGGKKITTPVRQVINVLIMVLEKNPNIGPVIKAYRHEIEDAIFEEIESGK